MPADWRWLPYLLRFQLSLEPQLLTGEEPYCSSPVQFPEDPDEPMPIVFSCSLNEFTKMLSSLIKGAQLSYPDTFVDVMNMFMRNWECDMDLCERMAICFTEQNEALMIAVAGAIETNNLLQNAIGSAISELGSAIPGQPLTTSQSMADFLPPNVKVDDECDLNALWGACLFLVQSGNRAITDVFEAIEAASNTLETSAIVAETIPAAGDYAAAAANFADQLQENLTEGYAAAYTEEYEEQLACEIFCAARAADCTLDMDTLVGIMNNRLPDPEDILNFGLVMARIGTGTFSGEEIANAAFLIYFTALKFGQQFGDTIGIRPLTDLMSLGADQLASDNWEVLCDCPECGVGYTVDIGTVDGDNIVSAATSLVERLDIPPATAYGRRIQVTFDAPVSSVELGWNTEGALDDMFAAGAGLTAETLPAPSGSTTLMFPEAITTLFVDLGYAGDSGAYASNPARITIVDACE